jgi:hypothetical protein
MPSVPLPISSRNDFQAALAEAIAVVGDLVRAAPRFEPYQEIEMQLDAMRRWTADGREPTPDERASINIGLVIIRELDPQPDPPTYAKYELLRACHHYFRQWPPDGQPPY